LSDTGVGDERGGRSNVDEIWHTTLMQNDMPIADCDDMIEIETGSRIPVWQTLVLFKPEIDISQRALNEL